MQESYTGVKVSKKRKGKRNKSPDIEKQEQRLVILDEGRIKAAFKKANAHLTGFLRAIEEMILGISSEDDGDDEYDSRRMR